MIINLDSKLKEKIKAQNPTVMRGVLESIDQQLIKSLKETKEDVRYIQGYSAAIDYLLSLLPQP